MIESNRRFEVDEIRKMPYITIEIRVCTDTHITFRLLESECTHEFVVAIIMKSGNGEVHRYKLCTFFLLSKAF